MSVLEVEEAPKQVSPRTRAALLFAIKEGGDLESAQGACSRELKNRLAERGTSMANSTMTVTRQLLEDEGLIEVDRSGKHTYSIKLKSIGDYVDPLSDEGKELYGYAKDTSAQAAAQKRTPVEKIILEVKRLPVSERIMLLGLIADECVTELEEREEKVNVLIAALR